MTKTCIVLFCVLTGSITACASESPDSVDERYQSDDRAVRPGPAETTSLEHPIIRAELLTVTAGTIIDLVGGVAYITRDHREAIRIHGALALAQDDLLQIHSDSAVRLRAPDGKEIELRREHGEWFRFSVRGK